MIQTDFAYRVKHILEKDDRILGVAVGGSWIAQQIDEFSDLDLVLVTKDKIAPNKANMIAIAESLGDFLSGFTGEHVGEPRLLICLYDNPLLHVDLKFVTLDEFKVRVETPFILLDKNGLLQQAIQDSEAQFPYPDYQWIEDRFWTWIHYALLKIGRGEYLEALDFLGFLRMVVLGSLLHIKNGNLPRGVRKVEMELEALDYQALISTVPTYQKADLLKSLRNAVVLYQKLRRELFDQTIQLNPKVEMAVLTYFDSFEV
jgi:hypothetical protein